MFYARCKGLDHLVSHLYTWTLQMDSVHRSNLSIPTRKKAIRWRWLCEQHAYYCAAVSTRRIDGTEAIQAEYIPLSSLEAQACFVAPLNGKMLPD